MLTGPRLNVRPDGGGRLLLQALDLDATADPAKPYPPDGEIASAMLARLPEVLDATGGTVVEKVRVGQRAMPGDGFTVAGFPAADVPFYVVATHSGITLAPLLGRLVADELYGHESPC
ncbi:FAD-dependent oxidoreductase [Streptomyces indonesiensis]